MSVERLKMFMEINGKKTEVEYVLASDHDRVVAWLQAKLGRVDMQYKIDGKHLADLLHERDQLQAVIESREKEVDVVIGQRTHLDMKCNILQRAADQVQAENTRLRGLLRTLIGTLKTGDDTIAWAKALEEARAALAPPVDDGGRGWVKLSGRDYAIDPKRIAADIRSRKEQP